MAGCDGWVGALTLETGPRAIRPVGFEADPNL